MGSLAKRIDYALNRLDRKRHIFQQTRGYKRRYSFVLKSNVTNPPAEVSANAIGSVWNQYGKVNPKWAQYYYSVNGIASPYYIPTDFWFTKICRKMNSIDRFGWPLFQDKNYIDLIFKDVRQPQVVLRNVSGQFLNENFKLLTLTEAAALCVGKGELIIKPSIESKGGKSIEFINNSDENSSEVSIYNILKERDGDFVVQKVLKQHHKMAELNPDSINSVRVLTLLWGGQVRILSSLVRIGVKGCRIDNPHTSNGFSCVLTSEGKMIDTVYDRDWKPYKELPNGLVVEGFEVPFYDRIIETVTRLHPLVPHFRIIGWDMTVSEDGEPIMIEANLDSPEVYFHQTGGGPLIKDPDLFNEIMSFVTGK